MWEPTKPTMNIANEKDATIQNLRWPKIQTKKLKPVLETRQSQPEILPMKKRRWTKSQTYKTKIEMETKSQIKMKAGNQEHKKTNWTNLRNPIWFTDKNADEKTTTFCTDAPNGLRYRRFAENQPSKRNKNFARIKPLYGERSEPSGARGVRPSCSQKSRR